MRGIVKQNTVTQDILISILTCIIYLLIQVEYRPIQNEDSLTGLEYIWYIDKASLKKESYM